MKQKNNKGVSMIMMIIIVIIVLILTSIVIVSTKKTNEETQKNNENTGNIGSTENVEKSNTTKSIAEIKKENYPAVFGENGTMITPSQSYCIANKIFINPNNDERIVIIDASSSIKSTSKTNEFKYIVDEKKRIDFYLQFSQITNTSANGGKYELVESNGGQSLYRWKRADGTFTNNSAIITFDDVPFFPIFGNNPAYKNDKCALFIKPNYEIESNKEYIDIANKVIKVDNSRELTDDLIQMKEKFDFGNVLVDFSKVKIYSWNVLGSGSSEIIYYFKNGETHNGVNMQLPVSTYSNINKLKASIDKLDYYKLVEFDVNGQTFYGQQITSSDKNNDIFEVIYFELSNGKLVSFSKLGEIKTIESVKDAINNYIVNQVLFIK